MFESTQISRAVAVGCLSAVTLIGASATAAADSPDDETLAGLVPAGSGDCQVSNLYPEDPFIARVGCGQNGAPGGPYSAVYSLYGNPAGVDATFGRLAATGDPVPCPGATGPEPTAWGGGMVACAVATGPRQGASTVSWTKAGDVFVGSATGNDLDALYTWWLGAR